MSGDTLVGILLALPFILSVIALWIVGPDTPEDDAHSLADGDVPAIPNGFHAEGDTL